MEDCKNRDTLKEFISRIPDTNLKMSIKSKISNIKVGKLNSILKAIKIYDVVPLSYKLKYIKLRKRKSENNNAVIKFSLNDLLFFHKIESLYNEVG